MLSNKDLLGILRFLLIIILVGLLLRLIISVGVRFSLLSFIERAHVVFFLKLLGVDFDLTVISGLPSIIIGNHVLVIGEACTSVRSFFLFIALLLATPSSVNKKWRGLSLIIIIYLFNIARLIFLCLVLLLTPSLFDFFHLFLWREGLSLLVVGLWYYWFKFL